MKFHYVYILKSEKKDFKYVGQTKDLKNRLARHNNEEVKSTKSYVPLELIYYEAYRDIKDAIKREKYLKTSKGKTTIKTMLKNYLKCDR